MFFKEFMHLTYTDSLACPNPLVGHSLVSLYHEPRTFNVVFGRRRRRTSLAQIKPGKPCLATMAPVPASVAARSLVKIRHSSRTCSTPGTLSGAHAHPSA
ncbi:hypothetical protein EVAR_32096_1 [Eumeta japonica]|uniref:Uncharacterized protein n=1 Tax=Eumeta variegata TaxID=151549 RepID=A0A4C1V467_EUMVA|nr:hypothetical protein EVAR_32096_1 [Eumeta japonica]